MRFTRHPLLAEVRDWGGDFGPRFYSSSVGDAIACLEALAEPDLDGLGDGLALRDRLLERMWALRAEEHERSEAIAGHGGPETLLHGDLWLKNVSVARRGERVPVRLIDWDHAGVGPPGYDLSTFVNGFSPEERDGVLDLYGEAVADAGWQLPSRNDMDYLFSTFELGRLANCVIWPALAAADGVEGALEELAMSDDWLGSLEAAPHAS
jgi:aminoglycoside phosphotransferase (APT) family kinase protein